MPNKFPPGPSVLRELQKTKTPRISTRGTQYELTNTKTKIGCLGKYEGYNSFL